MHNIQGAGKAPQDARIIGELPESTPKAWVFGCEKVWIIGFHRFMGFYYATILWVMVAMGYDSFDCSTGVVSLLKRGLVRTRHPNLAPICVQYSLEERQRPYSQIVILILFLIELPGWAWKPPDVTEKGYPQFIAKVSDPT
ncbi:hypothetical protein C8R47DRAFT_1063419 [Mycena vitilis]|nr:hypothetical protein C8R47DRAFT_1063419 [Mycena vitilis]